MAKLPAAAQPPADDLADQAVPIAGPDPLTVAIEDIALPPAHLVDQLDNSGPAPAEEEDKPEVATLDFIGDDLPAQSFVLKHPFRWEGTRVDTITVRQLSVAQLGALMGRLQRAGKPSELFDIYAEMCGLPAPVLRALPTADGEPIVDKAFDFLPRYFRPAGG